MGIIPGSRQVQGRVTIPVANVRGRTGVKQSRSKRCVPVVHVHQCGSAHLIADIQVGSRADQDVDYTRIVTPRSVHERGLALQVPRVDPGTATNQ